MKIKYLGGVYKTGIFYSDETGKKKIAVGDIIEIPDTGELAREMKKDPRWEVVKESKNKEVKKDGN